LLDLSSLSPYIPVQERYLLQEGRKMAVQKRLLTGDGIEMKKSNVKQAEGALQTIGAETMDLIVDHELHGVTPEMLGWWWWNMVDPEYYRLWHPEDHISIEWEVAPSKGRLVGSIFIAEERIGKIPATKIRMLVLEPASSPIIPIYDNIRATCILGPENKPVGWIMHEYRAEPYGIRMRSTFRLSKNSSSEFVNALREHNKEEMGQFARFLPALYKQKAAT
jgi:hypothetical protein